MENYTLLNKINKKVINFCSPNENDSFNTCIHCYLFLKIKDAEILKSACLWFRLKMRKATMLI